MKLEKRVSRLDHTIQRQNQQLMGLQQKRLFFGLGTFALLVLSQISFAKNLYLHLIALLVFFPIFVYFFRRSRIKSLFYP